MRLSLSSRDHSWLFVRSSAVVIFIAFGTVVCAGEAAAKKGPPPTPAAGDVLVGGGVGSNGDALSSAEFYVPSMKKFFSTGSLNTARGGIQAQWFPNGPSRVKSLGVMIGGFSGSASLSGGAISFDISTLDTVETFDPATGTFTTLSDTMANNLGNALTSSMMWPGTMSSSIAYDESHALVWGGLCNASALTGCHSSSKIHGDRDPVEVSGTSNPKVPSMMTQLTLLPDDTALATGGFGDFNGGTLSDAESLDPSNSELITDLGNVMNSQRAGHSATTLPDGTVLIVGGFLNSSGTLNSVNTAEIYDPTSKKFTALSSTLNQPRAFHSAMLLTNGKVLIAGGYDGSATLSLSGSGSGVTGALTMGSGNILNTAEMYDPQTQMFSCVGAKPSKNNPTCKPSMKSSRMFAAASELKTGGVLLTGGLGTPKGSKSVEVLSTAELFVGRFHKVGNMTDARAMHGSTLILP